MPVQKTKTWEIGVINFLVIAIQFSNVQGVTMENKKEKGKKRERT